MEIPASRRFPVIFSQRSKGRMITAEQIISLLQLEPHSEEGGYYVETYRSREKIPEPILPERYRGARSFATVIYYLLTPHTFSVMHKLQTDEIFHFYLGDPVKMLQLGPDDSGRILILGTNLLRGMRPQVIVPAGVWQGSCLLPGGRFALLGTTVSPGFERADYEKGQRDFLVHSYPRFRDQIVSLTK
jgi:predicted cupin superfamily sugar epimerase